MKEPSPIERAASVYLTEPCARTFDEDLTLHLLHGYVFSTPRLFMMGRPVEKDADYTLVTDPSHEFADPDAWLVYLAAGDMREFFRFEPFLLPFIGFERDNELRFHKRDRIKTLCEHGYTLTDCNVGKISPVPCST